MKGKSVRSGWLYECEVRGYLRHDGRAIRSRKNRPVMGSKAALLRSRSCLCATKRHKPVKVRVSVEEK